jgi:hypothetical protein
MSDVSQGEGWWLASDGKWYPPESNPQPVVPPPYPGQPPATESGEPAGNLEFGGWPALPTDPEPMAPVADPSVAGPPAYGPPPAPGQVPPPYLPPPGQYPAGSPGYAAPGMAFPPGGPQAGWAPGTPAAPAGSTNGLAIASLVLGILWFLGLGSILAVIFGFVARRQMRARNQGGNGLAIAGIVLGFVGIAVLMVGIIGVVASNGTQRTSLTVITYTQPCSSSLFNDGTTVIVRGNSGNQLAAANLSRGTDGTANLNDGTQIPTCTYNASMTLPGDQTSYTFTVGGHTPITFSRHEMTSSGWQPGITFGCPSDLQGGC